MHDPFRHEALPYRGRDEFVSACLSLVHEAQVADQRLMFLAPSAKLLDIEDALADSGDDDIAFVPTDEHGRNPCRITTLLDTFQAAGDGRPAVGVNESVFATRSPAAMREAQFAETVLNSAALRSWPLSVVCLYDSAELEPTSLSEMRRSHPTVRGEDDNPDYQPTLATDLFGAPLDDPPADAAVLEIVPGGLRGLRAAVRAHGVREALSSDRAEDLVLAANEVVTNGLRHGGGRSRVAMWTDGDSVVCEVRDSGVIADPLVGRLAPRSNAPSGRGLWLVNHLCDLVQLRSSPQSGTVVRLFVDR
jgi:anti-sigma regulatory factor (Ser/Thr protein kinase)